MVDIQQFEASQQAALAKYEKSRRALLPTIDKGREQIGRSCGQKTSYQTVAATTRVPWAVIAVIHEREASQKLESKPRSRRSVEQGFHPRSGGSWAIQAVGGRRG